MDVTHHVHGIEFEWDLDKAEANLAKHGVDFETACETFFDPFVKALATETSQQEAREVLVGMTLHLRLLCVVYVERHGDRFRLISARAATSAERLDYEEQ